MEVAGKIIELGHVFQPCLITEVYHEQNMHRVTEGETFPKGDVRGIVHHNHTSGQQG